MNSENLQRNFERQLPLNANFNTKNNNPPSNFYQMLNPRCFVQLIENHDNNNKSSKILDNSKLIESLTIDNLEESISSTWVYVGSLAESMNEMEKALTFFESALRYSPNNYRILIKIANIYCRKELFHKAAELYEKYLYFFPDNSDAWCSLGYCCLLLDDFQRAYATYQKALYHLENTNIPKLWHGIGILYDRYGSIEYAEEAFLKVLELDSNFEKHNEVVFRLGIIYKYQGKFKASLECFQYIINNPPPPMNQSDILFHIGNTLDQQKDWLGAKNAYEKALKINSQNAKVLQQLGCLYIQNDNFYDSKSSDNQNTNNYSQLDLDLALKYLTDSSKIDKNDAYTWYYLGRVHVLRDDFSAAYDAFQKTIDRDSKNPVFWCSIGVLYYQISQYPDALDAYIRAIKLNPYISEVWYNLGSLYESCNNQINDALDAYRQAEILDPNNPHIKLRLDHLLKFKNDENKTSIDNNLRYEQPRKIKAIELDHVSNDQKSKNTNNSLMPFTNRFSSENLLNNMNSNKVLLQPNIPNPINQFNQNNQNNQKVIMSNPSLKLNQNNLLSHLISNSTSKNQNYMSFQFPSNILQNSIQNHVNSFSSNTPTSKLNNYSKLQDTNTIHKRDLEEKIDTKQTKKFNLQDNIEHKNSYNLSNKNTKNDKNIPCHNKNNEGKNLKNSSFIISKTKENKLLVDNKKD